MYSDISYVNHSADAGKSAPCTAAEEAKNATMDGVSNSKATANMAGPLILRPCSNALIYVWNTPVLNSATSGFNAAASSASINASRVCAGSIIASTHSRAAAYLGSVWCS